MVAWDEDDSWARKVAGGAIVLVGELSDAAEADAADDERAIDELREYINNHEIAFFMPDRTFQVGCRAHVRAREVLATGLIPASFRCPISRARCPMRKALACAGGKSIRLHWPERL